MERIKISQVSHSPLCVVVGPQTQAQREGDFRLLMDFFSLFFPLFFFLSLVSFSATSGRPPNREECEPDESRRSADSGRLAASAPSVAQEKRPTSSSNSSFQGPKHKDQQGTASFCHPIGLLLLLGSSSPILALCSNLITTRPLHQAGEMGDTNHQLSPTLRLGCLP